MRRFTSKVAAVSTVIAMFVTNIAFAHLPATTLSAIKPSFADVPDLGAFVSLRGIAKPARKTGPLVIHIQDIHGNLEAQTNISKTIARLIDVNRVGLIALEGASGPIDLSALRAYPRKKTIAAVANYFLKTNRISGPIHAALTSTSNPPAVSGVEEDAHYRSNVDAVRRALAQKDVALDELNKRSRELARRKSAVLNPRLAQFDRRVEEYRDKTLPLAAYVAWLAPDSKKAGPAINDFLEALRLESSIDFSKAEQERAVLMKQSRSSTRTAPNLEAYPHFKKYARYAELAASIDLEAMLADVQRFEDEQYARRVRSKTERELVLEGKRIWLERKLVEFSLTKAEWGICKAWRMRESLKSFADFYSVAEARDAGMARRLLERAPNLKIVVLVTGGFHAAGVRETLVANGCAVVSAVPRVTKMDGANAGAYLSVFAQQKTPLEKLFDGEKLSLAKPPIQPVTLDVEAPINAALFEAASGGPVGDNPASNLIRDPRLSIEVHAGGPGESKGTAIFAGEKLSVAMKTAGGVILDSHVVIPKKMSTATVDDASQSIRAMATGNKPVVMSPFLFEKEVNSNVIFTFMDGEKRKYIVLGNGKGRIYGSVFSKPKKRLNLTRENPGDAPIWRAIDLTDPKLAELPDSSGVVMPPLLKKKLASGKSLTRNEAMFILSLLMNRSDASAPFDDLTSFTFSMKTKNLDFMTVFNRFSRESTKLTVGAQGGKVYGEVRYLPGKGYVLRVTRIDKKGRYVFRSWRLHNRGEVKDEGHVNGVYIPPALKTKISKNKLLNGNEADFLFSVFINGRAVDVWDAETSEIRFKKNSVMQTMFQERPAGSDQNSLIEMGGRSQGRLEGVFTPGSKGVADVFLVKSEENGKFFWRTFMLPPKKRPVELFVTNSKLLPAPLRNKIGRRAPLGLDEAHFLISLAINQPHVRLDMKPASLKIKGAPAQLFKVEHYATKKLLMFKVGGKDNGDVEGKIRFLPEGGLRVALTREIPGAAIRYRVFDIDASGNMTESFRSDGVVIPEALRKKLAKGSVLKEYEAHFLLFLLVNFEDPRKKFPGINSFSFVKDAETHRVLSVTRLGAGNIGIYCAPDKPGRVTCRVEFLEDQGYVLSLTRMSNEAVLGRSMFALASYRVLRELSVQPGATDTVYDMRTESPDVVDTAMAAEDAIDFQDLLATVNGFIETLPTDEASAARMIISGYKDEAIRKAIPSGVSVVEVREKLKRVTATLFGENFPAALSPFNPFTWAYPSAARLAEKGGIYRLPAIMIAAAGGYVEEVWLRLSIYAVVSFCLPSLHPLVSSVGYAVLFGFVFHSNVFVGNGVESAPATLGQKLWLTFLGGLFGLIWWATGDILLAGAAHAVYNVVARWGGAALAMTGAANGNGGKENWAQKLNDFVRDRNVETRPGYDLSEHTLYDAQKEEFSGSRCYRCRAGILLPYPVNAPTEIRRVISSVKDSSSAEEARQMAAKELYEKLTAELGEARYPTSNETFFPGVVFGLDATSALHRACIDYGFALPSYRIYLDRNGTWTAIEAELKLRVGDPIRSSRHEISNYDPSGVAGGLVLDDMAVVSAEVFQKLGDLYPDLKKSGRWLVLNPKGNVNYLSSLQRWADRHYARVDTSVDAFPAADPGRRFYGHAKVTVDGRDYISEQTGDTPEEVRTNAYRGLAERLEFKRLPFLPDTEFHDVAPRPSTNAGMLMYAHRKGVELPVDIDWVASDGRELSAEIFPFDKSAEIAQRMIRIDRDANVHVTRSGMAPRQEEQLKSFVFDHALPNRAALRFQRVQAAHPAWFFPHIDFQLWEGYSAVVLRDEDGKPFTFAGASYMGAEPEHVAERALADHLRALKKAAGAWDGPEKSRQLEPDFPRPAIGVQMAETLTHLTEQLGWRHPTYKYFVDETGRVVRTQASVEVPRATRIEGEAIDGENQDGAARSLLLKLAGLYPRIFFENTPAGRRHRWLLLKRRNGGLDYEQYVLEAVRRGVVAEFRTERSPDGKKVSATISLTDGRFAAGSANAENEADSVNAAAKNAIDEANALSPGLFTLERPQLPEEQTGTLLKDHKTFSKIEEIKINDSHVFPSAIDLGDGIFHPTRGIRDPKLKHGDFVDPESLKGPVLDYIEHAIKNGGGGQAFIGGVVRALLLGQDPSDYDVNVVSPVPAELRAALYSTTDRVQKIDAPIDLARRPLILKTRGLAITAAMARFRASLDPMSFDAKPHQWGMFHGREVQQAFGVAVDPSGQIFLSSPELSINSMALAFFMKEGKLKIVFLDPWGGRKDLHNLTALPVGPINQMGLDGLLRFFRFASSLFLDDAPAAELLEAVHARLVKTPRGQEGPARRKLESIWKEFVRKMFRDSEDPVALYEKLLSFRVIGKKLNFVEPLERLIGVQDFLKKEADFIFFERAGLDAATIDRFMDTNGEPQRPSIKRHGDLEIAVLDVPTPEGKKARVVVDAADSEDGVRLLLDERIFEEVQRPHSIALILKGRLQYPEEIVDDDDGEDEDARPLSKRFRSRVEDADDTEMPLRQASTIAYEDDFEVSFIYSKEKGAYIADDQFRPEKKTVVIRHQPMERQINGAANALIALADVAGERPSVKVERIVSQFFTGPAVDLGVRFADALHHGRAVDSGNWLSILLRDKFVQRVLDRARGPEAPPVDPERLDDLIIRLGSHGTRKNSRKLKAVLQTLRAA